MADTKKFLEAIRKIIINELKGMKAPYVPVKAKVVRTHLAEDVYFADIKILKLDGSEDSDFPVLPYIEAPTQPTNGGTVRVNFYYGDMSQPYIEQVL